MNSFLVKPIWIWISGTLPLFIMLGLLYSNYDLINLEIHEEVLSRWHFYLGSTSLLFVLTGCIGLFHFIRNEDVGRWSAVVLSIFQVFFMGWILVYADDLIPRSVPNWIISRNDFFFLPLVCLMPGILYDLYVLALYSSDTLKGHHFAKDLGLSLLSPFVIYIVILTISQFYFYSGESFNTLFLVLFIASSVFMMFFFLRGMLLFIKNKEKNFYETWVFNLIVSLLFPSIGLYLNHELNDVFGSFHKWWLWSIGLGNAIFILFPVKGAIFVLWRFIGRLIFFPFTFYFFLVFIPFIPFALPAILLMGVGLLMLTPLALLIVHLRLLVEDFHLLKKAYSSLILSSIIVVSMGALPAGFQLMMMEHKTQLHAALEYVYENGDKEKIMERVQPFILEDALLQMEENFLPTSANWDKLLLGGHKFPILGQWYQSYVLQNMTLSETKREALSHIFLGNVSYKYLYETKEEAKEVIINSLDKNTVWDQEAGCYRTDIDFELKNTDTTGWRMQEFYTKIELPSHVLVKDYYLDVLDKRKKGILAEKKTALWVYEQIRRTNRDPGLLRYKNSKTLEFNVFPFSQNEVRKTGIQFWHTDSFQLNVSRYGSVSISIDSISKGNVTTEYICIPDSNTLIQRKPFFYFIVDGSQQAEKSKKNFIDWIDKCIKSHPEITAQPKLMICGAFPEKCTFEDREKILLQRKYSGGAYVDRAIKEAILDTNSEHSDLFPVIVYVSEDVSSGYRYEDLMDYERFIPEHPFVHTLSPTQNLRPHSLDDLHFADSMLILHKFPDLPKVSLQGNDKQVLPVLSENESLNIFADAKVRSPFEEALRVRALDEKFMLLGERSGVSWLELVKSAFKHRVLNRQTSFIVLETETQEKALLEKQELVLNASGYMDITSDSTNIQMMSEPEVWAYGLVLMLILLYQLFLQYKKL